MSDDALTACSDETLFAKCCRGDAAAFGVLVRRYERELYGYLRRYLGDASLADDVFQNTFLQLYLKRDQYEAGRPVPEHHVGEILLAGPSVMLGYYRQEALTAQTVRDQFYPKSMLQLDEVKGMPELMQDAIAFKYIPAALTPPARRAASAPAAAQASSAQATSSERLTPGV